MKKYYLQNTKFLYFTNIFLMTIVLLIAVSIYCYQAKRKHFLRFHNTNNELKEPIY